MKSKWIAALLAMLCLLLCACRQEEPPVEKKYEFSYKNVTLCPGDKLPELLSELSGEPVQISDPSPSCLKSIPGEDMTYRYAGFSLQSFRLKEGDPEEQLRIITLLDDSVSTPEGVAIGATGEGVIAAYGTPTEQTDARLVYAGKGMKLSFGLRDGKVTAISYEIVD